MEIIHIKHGYMLRVRIALFQLTVIIEVTRPFNFINFHPKARLRLKRSAIKIADKT